MLGFIGLISSLVLPVVNENCTSTEDGKVKLAELKFMFILQPIRELNFLRKLASHVFLENILGVTSILMILKKSS